ncbi:MAG: ABC transporter permease, partial [Prolixibacteraceae bacterium]|nr:ABC transporter permease [Prolixibacteraceae bacterium]
MKFRDIKAFIKQLSRNKLYSLVTIFGFSVSLMFVILLSAYIKQELSVDKFHAKKDRLYRLVNEGHSTFGSTIGQKIQDALPEIECETRAYNYYFEIYFYAQGAPNKKLNADLLMVDSTFFNMFSFNLEEGNATEVLLLKNSAVVTRHFARSLFGDESPVGKQIISSNNVPLIITGVMDDFPENTQFRKCDAVVNYQLLADFWENPQVTTTDGASIVSYYFLAKEGTNLPAKNGQALALLKKDFWMYEQERVKTLDFEPITASYFSNKRGEIKQNSKTLVTVLSAITLLILILSVINYINLTIAQSGFRNKEVAIKKLMGSSRGSLIRQHISESVFICFIAFGLGILLSSVARPVFNSLLETNINITENVGISTIAGFVAIVLFVGAISGIIPALYLTGLNPAEVVKGSFQKKNKTAYSKVLVSFQFAATIALIICASFIVKQTR